MFVQLIEHYIKKYDDYLHTHLVVVLMGFNQLINMYV